MRRLVLGSTLAALLAAGLPAGVAAAGPFDGPCARLGLLHVRGAEAQRVLCLDDLTTAGLVDGVTTDSADWAGLHAPDAVTPSGVPGIQVDGCFPDTSDTNTNDFGPCAHDAQFVMRLPDEWNGGLVVSGSPGVREQYANDKVLGDDALGRGYAFVSTDKGNTGVDFHTDGDEPGDAIAEWHQRVTQLARASRSVVAQRYGRAPDRTYAAGISNGGYLVRWQLENAAALYDGGVDWEGVLWTPEENLLTVLPPVLRAFPVYADTTADPAARQAAREQILEAGFAAGSEFLWPRHADVYWDLTQRIYREELDPSYDGDAVAGTPDCVSGTPACDADYDLAARPDEVREAIERISLTGRLRRPMLTVHGTLDSLTPLAPNTLDYATMIDERDRSRLHRAYAVEGGQHVDGFLPLFPGAGLRPLLPCYRDAFDALEAWVEDGVAPPASGTVPQPPPGTDALATCDVAAR